MATRTVTRTTAGAGLSAACVVAGLLTLAAPGAARADTGFRCDSGRLASTGDTTYEVRKKCGAPDDVVVRLEKRKQKVRLGRWVGDRWEEYDDEREVDVQIEEWTYDLGPGRLIRYVLFENGCLVRVRTGDRVPRRDPS